MNLINLGRKAYFMQFKDIILFAIFIGSLATFINGNKYGLGNHIEQLPIVLRFLDSTYLTKDFFVNASSGFGPRFYYSKLLALLGTYFPLPIVCLFLTWLSNIAVCFITCIVARNLFKGSNFIAMMAGALVMSVASIDLGKASMLFDSYLTPQVLAMPFALLALWAGIKQRPLACVAPSVLISFIHPLMGILSGMIGLSTIGISILFKCNGENRIISQDTSKKILRLFLGTLILGLVTLFFWIIPQKETVSIDSTRFISILAHFRSPHHYVPSAFERNDYIGAICFLFIFAVSWKWWYDDISTDKVLARRLLIMIIIVLVLFIGGYIFVEIFPMRIWTIIQTFRMFFVVKWLGLIVLARTISHFIKKAHDSIKLSRGRFHCIGNGCLKIALSQKIIRSGIGIALSLASVILIVKSSAKEVYSLLLFVLISFWFLFFSKRKYGNLILIFFICGAVLWVSMNKNRRIPFSSHCFGRLQPSITLEDLKGPDIEIAKYARDNIHEDAVFITPPWLGIFRLIARRAIVVDYKAFPLSVDWAMVEWKERLSDCYGEVKGVGFAAGDEMDKQYRKITKDRLMFIAKKYGATYAVLYKETSVEFPVIFENNVYKIVEIEKNKR